MKPYKENTSKSSFNEEEVPFVRVFSSQEEAEAYRIRTNLKMTDMQRFRLFCRMVRIGNMLSNAKIVK